MKEAILYAFIGMGVLASVGTLYVGTRPALMGIGEETIAAIGILPWGAVALGATNVEKITDCCRMVYSEPFLSFGGSVMVVFHIVLLLWGVTALLDVREATQEAPDRG